MGESDRTMIDEKALSQSSPSRATWPRAALGYALAFACLVWIFRDFHFGELLRRVAAMNLLWVAAAIFCDVLSYVCQGARWKLLLRPSGQVTVRRTTQAIYAGLFVNEVLPMRLGELVRAVLISRWTTVKLGSVVASMLIERLCDGLWLAAGIILTILLVPLPRILVEAGDVFGLGILVALVLFILIAVAGRRKRPDSSAPTEADVDLELNTQMRVNSEVPGNFRLARRLYHTAARSVRRLVMELQVIGRTARALLACVLSLILLLLQGLSLWLVMRAFGLSLPITVGLAVFMIVHLGTMVPAAPANIGTYQFFTVLGLTLFGVDKTTAAGFSLVVFAVLTVPLWGIGFWALGCSGLTLLEVRSGLAKSWARLRADGL